MKTSRFLVFIKILSSLKLTNPLISINLVFWLFKEASRSSFTSESNLLPLLLPGFHANAVLLADSDKPVSV